MRKIKLATMDCEQVCGEIGDFVIEAVLETIALYKTGLHDAKKPIGTFLFVGPTGVGKTELAKALAAFLFGSESRLLRFDMSEFKDYHAFEMLIGNAEGKELRFPLFKERLTIGRTPHNDIQLNLRYVSRRHAVIATDQNGTRVIDWGSRNGLYVNQKRVTEHFLSSGDEITMGEN